MTWTPTDVMSRFVEAADTERRTPGKGMPMAKTCWPAYRFDLDDRKGWTEADKADEQRRWAETRGAKADAVSRYDECIEWGVTHITSNETRLIVWTWAFCQVMNRHFTTECKRRGWTRATAYRRLTRAFEQISGILNNDSVLLRQAAHHWVRQMPAVMASQKYKLANCDKQPAIWSDIPEQRDFTWAQRQAERQAERELARRRKLGLEPAPAGA